MSDNSRVRVSIVGVVIVALFASLFARLWFLQMGPEQKLGQIVSTLATRVIQTESPRGEILDRNGKVLAQDVAAWAVTVDRDLSQSTLDRVLGQLAEVLKVDEKTLRANYNSVRQSPLQPAIVKLEVPLEAQLAIREHSEDYPGVNVVELTVRSYPYDRYASQLLGYLGEVDAVSKDQFKQLQAKGYQPGDLIGRDGVEAAYESVLRGKPTRETVQVDPTGKQVGAPISVDPGTVGDNVKLTIDIKVQVAAEKALAEGISAARGLQDEAHKAQGFLTLKPTGGAVVVLNVHDGSVLAMASNPTYPLSQWVGGISSNNFALLSAPGAHNPLLNRVTEGLYAPGSTFKLVPSVALTRYGVRSPSEYITDDGSFKVGTTTFHNDNGAQNGPVDLQKALTVSSDIYFYRAGDDFWNRWTGGDTTTGLGIQTVASELGFGHSTGIALGDAAGRIPDPAWRAAYAKANYKTKDLINQYSIWYPGDNMNMAVGQGDDLVTPLQLANAYATFANGNASHIGTVWTPHVDESVTDPVTKKPISRFARKARGTVDFGGAYGPIAAGFRGVVADPSGTAYNAFLGLAIPVSGKTGTAEIANQGATPIGSTSVFASYFPSDNPQYAVVALVEQGGHGAQIAAPIVRQVIESITQPNLPPTPIPTHSVGKD
jgi:penicillin-binding protein 2